MHTGLRQAMCGPLKRPSLGIAGPLDDRCFRERGEYQRRGPHWVPGVGNPILEQMLRCHEVPFSNRLSLQGEPGVEQTIRSRLGSIETGPRHGG